MVYNRDRRSFVRTRYTSEYIDSCSFLTIVIGVLELAGVVEVLALSSSVTSLSILPYFVICHFHYA